MYLEEYIVPVWSDVTQLPLVVELQPLENGEIQSILVDLIVSH